jgi:hypothetical protein
MIYLFETTTNTSLDILFKNRTPTTAKKMQTKGRTSSAV